MVEICKERCCGEDAILQINRWLPILKKYAEKFGVRLVVDCSNGKQDVIENKDGSSTVFLHLNSYPSHNNLSLIKIKPDSIFGYLTPADYYLNNIEFGPIFTFPPPFKNINFIRSPEDVPLGYISGSNIFIHPGVLLGWPKSEDLRILSAILYWVLPEVAFGAKNLNEYSVLTNQIVSSYRDLKNNARVNFASRGRRNRISKALHGFLQLRGFAHLDWLNRELALINRKIDSQRDIYYKTLAEIYDLEERLEVATKLALKRSFGDEFDKILGIEGVRSVRVVKDQAGCKLVIMTGLIYQSPGDGENYNIGEFDIVINLKNTKRSAIYLCQSRDGGKYQHPHSRVDNGGMVCFGTTDQGLNADIERLISRLDVVPLVHLILTFLKKDSQKPELKPEGTFAMVPIISAPPDYEDEIDKSKERAAFIKSMKDEVTAVNTSVIIEDLAMVRQALSETAAEREKLRLTFCDLETSIEIAGAKIGRERELALQEVELFIRDSNVLGLAVNLDEIQIHFDVHNPNRPESVRKAKGYILRIQSNKPVDLFHSSADGQTCQVKLMGAKSPLLDPATERKLIMLQSRGNIYEAFLIIKNMIINDWSI